MPLEVKKVTTGEIERLMGAEFRNTRMPVWRNENTKNSDNVSLDSGIAGIKDPISSNNNNVYGCVENDTANAEYIVDPSTRTTYLKGKFLGKGGFARVHEIMDLTTNTVYAGKIIPKNRITKRHHMEKIAREILIHRNLIHENVVRLHHFFEDSVNAYIILENCSRKSLVHVLKHRGTLTEPEVRYFMGKLVLGVKYIHSQSIIHRDLKPGNMFLTENMGVKIGDFGLATQLDGDKRVTVCGTPNYIAPEVLNKLSYSFEADVWAMGCIMFTLMVGQPPFETPTLKETYSRIINNKYTIPYSVSETARELITKLLNPCPQDRPKVDKIFENKFFKNGYMPDTLAPSCCYSAPKFPAFPGISTSHNRRIPHKDVGPEFRCSFCDVKVQHNVPPLSKTKRVSKWPKIQIVAVLDDFTDSTNNISHGGCKTIGPLLLQSAEDSKVQTLANSMSTLKLSTPSQENKNVVPFPSNVDMAANPAPSSAPTEPKIPPCSPRPVSLKQKLSSVLCPDKLTLCRNGKRSCNAATLYDCLLNCVHMMPASLPGVSNPTHVLTTPLFISKWIDYSNKYGFGFQLSDKSVGVLFNDNTKISFSPDRSRVEFYDVFGKVTAHPHHSVPPILQDRLTLLQYFSRYMDENLTEGGDIKQLSSLHKSLVPQMKRWVRTNTAIIMELINGTLQINFFRDHTKVILSMGRHGYLLTYINSERVNRSYWLQDIARYGCEPGIFERLRFATAVLREFAELETTRA